MSGIAIVTGASSGIGTAFVRKLFAVHQGKENYKGLPCFDEIWLVARRESRLQKLSLEISEAADAHKGALKIRVFALDLAALDSVKILTDAALSQKAEGKFISILVNNAGIGAYGDFDKLDSKVHSDQIDLNCRALTEICSMLRPCLKQGSILINTASLAAFAPLGGFAVYAASKAYVLSLSVGLAAEWAVSGIRVCALCPGPVESEFALIASAGARTKVHGGYSADKTVSACLRDAARGKWISMPRVLWRFRRFAAWIGGPELSALFAYKHMKRPRSES